MKPPQMFQPDDFEIECLSANCECSPRLIALRAQAIFENWYELNRYWKCFECARQMCKPQNPETDGA